MEFGVRFCLRSDLSEEADNLQKYLGRPISQIHC